jgi:hypothetical protein
VRLRRRAQTRRSARRYGSQVWRGSIRADDEEPRRKGLPPAHRLLVEPDDGSGRQLSIRLGPPDPGDGATATFVSEILYREFDECPICRDVVPTSREHVPQRSIGGQVRTLTCAPCNNGLGSRLEAEFTDWCFDRLVHVGAEGDAVLGRRRIPRIYRRWTDEGEFVWLLDGRVDPGVREMLQEGGISVIFREPDPARWRLAALKHAYLAACCHLGAVPESRTADMIRDVLIGARDAPARSSIELSQIAADLRIGRTDGPPQGPSLALMTVAAGGSEERAEAWISLAGTVLVRWPLPDVPTRPPA